MDAANQLRLNYQKEIIYLRECIFRKEKLGKEFPDLEVEFFDIGQGLTPDQMDILNEKVYQLRAGYQKMLKRFAEQNQALYDKVAKLDVLNSKLVCYHKLRFIDI